MLEQQSILALLQTFEVTARHLSFTLAAHEMNLTQGAVSHRIRKLEMHIGFRLFIRLTRKLALTEEGKRLLATLSHSLRAINDEIEDIREQDLRGTLHIGIAPTLAHLWLMPRLPRFQAQWPALNLQFRVRAGVMDFNEERVDLAIYYGASRYPDLYQQRLMGESCYRSARRHIASSSNRLAPAPLRRSSGSMPLNPPMYRISSPNGGYGASKADTLYPLTGVIMR